MTDQLVQTKPPVPVDTLKTKGINKRVDAAGRVKKDYEITHPDGTVYRACIGIDGQFHCRGIAGTLKHVKGMIAEGKMIGVEEAPPEEVVQGEAKPRGTFDCIDPCALLVLFLKGVGEINAAGQFPLEDPTRHSAYHTLDCYGWITEAGTADVAMASKNFTAHQPKLEKNDNGNGNPEG